MAELKLRELLFPRPEFPDDVFVTVRRGTKWARPCLIPADTDLVQIKETDGPEIALGYITARYVGPLHLIPAEWLALEHDVRCRTHVGLLAEMRRVYEDQSITGDERVTALRVEIRVRHEPPYRIMRTAAENLR